VVSLASRKTGEGDKSQWPGHVADHSPPSVPRLRVSGAMSVLPQHIFLAWCLIKHRDSFLTFTTFVWIRVRVKLSLCLIK
jgi:hypothetical protein